MDRADLRQDCFRGRVVAGVDLSYDRDVLIVGLSSLRLGYSSVGERFASLNVCLGLKLFKG